MTNKFLGFLETVGRDFAKYVIPFAKLGEAAVSLAIPGLGPVFAATANIVITVEQKWAALGKQTGSGSQKLADSLLIGEPLIAKLLADAGAAHDTAAVTAYINNVVGVLNLAPPPQAA